jgi:heptosyltransferase I
MNRILIIKPSSLGDIVHALPTFSALQWTFPSAQIDWLVKAQWAGLLERVEGIGRIWRIPPGLRGWASMIRPLRATAFDVIVDLQGLLRTGVMGWLAGASRRIGFTNAREGSRWFYTETVPVPTVEMHAVDRYLLVAATLGARRPSSRELSFGLKPLAEDRRTIAELLGAHGLQSGDRWIAISPAARWQTKHWPVESFARTADRIQDEGLGRVALIGSVEDRPTARELLRLMRTPALDLTGATPLWLLPALLESTAMLVTNDSGPMHVAAAVGTPVVALFGPTSATRTGPYGASHIVLQEALPCSPCFSRRCGNPVDRECLMRITPDRVVSAVRERLKVKVEAVRKVEVQTKAE